MIVLGIDPGLEKCGYAVIEENHNQLTPIVYECIFTQKTKDTSRRLIEIFDKITKIIKNYKPDVLVMEDLFFFKNAKTVIRIGEVRGVIILASEKQKVPVLSYPPLEIKMAITGYGRAEKEQIGQMVKNILHLKEIPTPDDTNDALAVAITHCQVNKLNSKLI